MSKPDLSIMGELHPFGFKGPIAGMLDVGFADDMGGMPDSEGRFDLDDDSDDHTRYGEQRSHLIH